MGLKVKLWTNGIEMDEILSHRWVVMGVLSVVVGYVGPRWLYFKLPPTVCNL